MIATPSGRGNAEFIPRPVATRPGFPRSAPTRRASGVKPVFEKQRALALALFEAIYSITQSSTPNCPTRYSPADAMARVPRANSSRRFSAYGRKADTVTAPKPPNALTTLPYSVRSAFIGSVEAARRAGRMLAIAAQTPKAMMEVPSTKGS